MNWLELDTIKSFTDGRLCKKSASTDGSLFKNAASCVQRMTEWRKEGTSFFKSQNSLLEADQENRTRRDFRPCVNGNAMFYEIFSEKK